MSGLYLFLGGSMNGEVYSIDVPDPRMIINTAKPNGQPDWIENGFPANTIFHQLREIYLLKDIGLFGRAFRVYVEEKLTPIELNALAYEWFASSLGKMMIQTQKG